MNYDIASVIDVVFDSNDNVLMLRRKERGEYSDLASCYEPIKGVIKNGETEGGAAERELLEEVGNEIKFKLLGHLPEYFYAEQLLSGVKKITKSKVFIWKYEGGSIKLSDKHSGFEFMNVDDAVFNNILSNFGSDMIAPAYEFLILNSTF